MPTIHIHKRSAAKYHKCVIGALRRFTKYTETIKNNCENLEINTLDTPEDNSENKISEQLNEEIYDNVDIVENNEKKDKTILEKFIENLSENEDEEDNTEEVINKKGIKHSMGI